MVVVDEADKIINFINLRHFVNGLGFSGPVYFEE